MAKTLSPAIQSKFRHGFVVGSFFPPHAGHLSVIRAAAQFSKKVTVVIDAPENKTLPLKIRKQAILDAIEFSNVTVVIDPKVFSKKQTFDAVFTSNNPPKLKNKKIAVVDVDPKRKLFPITSKQIRENTLRHWNDMLPIIQSYLCRRIVVVGAESSGKTTLCHDLVQCLQQQKDFITTPFVPEFGREFTFAKVAVEQEFAKKKKKHVPTIDTLDWVEKDFVQIAQVQNRWENEATKKGSPVIICDTDSFATAIWYERYKKAWPKSFDRIIRDLPERSLYMLVDEKDVPFEWDEIRNGEQYRTWMTEKFESEMRKREFPFVKIAGNRADRLKSAVEEIEMLLVWTWN